MITKIVNAKIKLGKYTKFISAIAGVVAVFAFVSSDGVIDSQDGAAIASAVITAGAVFGFRNKTVDEVQAELDAYAKSKNVPK